MQCLVSEVPWFCSLFPVSSLDVVSVTSVSLVWLVLGVWVFFCFFSSLLWVLLLLVLLPCYCLERCLHDTCRVWVDCQHEDQIETCFEIVFARWWSHCMVYQLSLYHCQSFSVIVNSSVMSVLGSVQRLIVCWVGHKTTCWLTLYA